MSAEQDRSEGEPSLSDKACGGMKQAQGMLYGLGTKPPTQVKGVMRKRPFAMQYATLRGFGVTAHFW